MAWLGSWKTITTRTSLASTFSLLRQNMCPLAVTLFSRKVKSSRTIHPIKIRIAIVLVVLYLPKVCFTFPAELFTFGPSPQCLPPDDPQSKGHGDSTLPPQWTTAALDAWAFKLHFIPVKNSGRRKPLGCKKTPRTFNDQNVYPFRFVESRKFNQPVDSGDRRVSPRPSVARCNRFSCYQRDTFWMVT